MSAAVTQCLDERLVGRRHNRVKQRLARAKRNSRAEMRAIPAIKLESGSGVACGRRWVGCDGLRAYNIKVGIVVGRARGEQLDRQRACRVVFDARECLGLLSTAVQRHSVALRNGAKRSNGFDAVHTQSTVNATSSTAVAATVSNTAYGTPSERMRPRAGEQRAAGACGSDAECRCAL